MEIKKQVIKSLPVEWDIKPHDLVVPPDSKMGDLSLACFGLAKKLDKSPVEVALEVVEFCHPERSAKREVEGSIGKVQKDSSVASLLQNDVVGGLLEKVEVAGPYVNFFLNPGVVANLVLVDIQKKKNKYGQSNIKKGENILIEYPSNNTHKEVHVGHLRIMCLGNALANIYETLGAKVIRANYINDFGAHVAKCLWGLMELHRGEKPPADKQKWLGQIYAEASTYLKDHPEHVEESKAMLKMLEAKDKYIWKTFLQTRQWSLDGFKKIFAELGVKHKIVFYEKNVKDLGQKEVGELLKKNIAEVGEGGAIIIDLKKYGLDIGLLRKSDGAGLYLTSDLGLAKVKAQKLPQVTSSINLTGAEQKFYFQQLFKILEIGGFKYKMSHVACEMVTLPGGEKMASRSGNVILYEMVRDEALQIAEAETQKRHPEWSKTKLQKTAEALAFGALKFSMIKVGSGQKIAFDIKEAVSFEGFTAPYLQYSLARMNSILEKVKTKLKVDSSLLVSVFEKKLILKLASMTEALQEAGEKQDPSQLAKYLFELCQDFSDFYENCPVMRAETPQLLAGRLGLIKTTKQVLENGLNILGVPIIKEM